MNFRQSLPLLPLLNIIHRLPLPLSSPHPWNSCRTPFHRYMIQRFLRLTLEELHIYKCYKYARICSLYLSYITLQSIRRNTLLKKIIIIRYNVFIWCIYIQVRIIQMEYLEFSRIFLLCAARFACWTNPQHSFLT